MAVSVESRPVRVRPAPPRRTAEAIVEARGVDKLYDTGKLQVRALNGVSFAVPRGEMVAIMGPSGSGKTTLLNCLSGLDRIDAGEVLIEGVALMRQLNRERGLTFLIVTHDIAVGRLTDRIVRMVDGEIVGEETLEVR